MTSQNDFLWHAVDKAFIEIRTCLYATKPNVLQKKKAILQSILILC